MIESAHDNSSKKSNLENILNAEGVVIGSDWHGHYGIVDGAFKVANDANYALVVNGDLVNDYALQSKAQSIGIKMPSLIYQDYLSKRLSETEMETLSYMQILEQYGGNLDAMLNDIPKEYIAQEKEKVSSILNESRVKSLQKTISTLSQSFAQSNEGKEYFENRLKFMGLYEVFMEEEAKRLAVKIKEYNNVTVLYNHGNHENKNFVSMVQDELERLGVNRNQIIDINQRRGYTKVKNKDAIEMTLAGMTNCIQHMPYLNEIFMPEELAEIYAHMNFKYLNQETILFGDANAQDVQAKKEIYLQDPEYRRIKEGSEDESLDIFLTHGQVAKPMTSSNKAYDVPYFASAAKLSLEAKLTVEGHIHSKWDGKNSLGRDMLRAAGEEVVMISKDSQGNLRKEWKKVGENYNGGQNIEIPYTNEYLLMRIEDKLKQYEMMMATNEEDFGEESEDFRKAA